MSFKDLGLLPELLKALKSKTYPSPTQVQRDLIPIALQGQDAWVTAPTGSGKTLAYALPLLEQWAHSISKNQPAGVSKLAYVKSTKTTQSLVLVPTRELAVQVSQLFMSLSAQWGHLCKITVVFGGVSINPQMNVLRSGTDILIATPRSLSDWAKQNSPKLPAGQNFGLG